MHLWLLCGKFRLPNVFAKADFILSILGADQNGRGSGMIT